MLSRTKGRESLLKVFYQYLFYLPAGQSRPSLKEMFYSVFPKEEDLKYYKDVFKVAINNASDVSNRASKYLNKWNFERLGLTDQAIIILADSEFRFFNIEKAIIINVYVDLAKRYSSDEDGYKYINGLLQNLL